jgi:chemosensory pili system protein ChpC
VSVVEMSAAGEIRGVLLPLGGHMLLLPNAAVAELIGFQNPEPDEANPDWLLGNLTWRGRRVPLVSFEQAAGLPRTEQGSQRLRIAVLNTLNGNEELPYIGLLTQGITRLTRVRATSLSDDSEGGSDSALVKAAVLISGQPAWIPDLDELEQRLQAIDG